LTPSLNSLQQAREHLISLSPTNRDTLTEIEDSLFVVSLDDWTRMHPSPHPTSISSQLLPVSASSSSPSPSPSFDFDPSLELDSHILNASSGRDGHNRWFDKSFSFNVESNTRAGVLGDHSPCDALIPGIISDYMAAEGMGRGKKVDEQTVGKVQPSLDGWRRLRWVTDERVERDIAKAEETVRRTVADSDALELWFDEYGVDWIKRSGKWAHVLGVTKEADFEMAAPPQPSSHRTLSSKWLSNWPTARCTAVRPPPTKPLRLDCSCMEGQT
jgi:carnitine O-acetyltransferase